MPGYVRWTRAAFNVLMWFFVAAVVLQVYLAGRGVFVSGAGFKDHQSWGYTFGLLVLVFPILALVGRMPRVWLGASVLLFVLFALQSVFVAMRADNPAIAALHPLNGFLIGLISVLTAWRTRGYLRAPRSATATTVEAAPETPPA